MVNSIKAALIVAALAIIPVEAEALTVTYSASYGPALTDFDSGHLTLAGFNSSLGRLTAVELDYAFSATMQGNVTNTSPTTKSFKVTEEVDPSFVFSAGAAYSDAITHFQTYALGGNATGTFTRYTGSVSGSGHPLNLADFIDTSLDVEFSTLTSTTILGGGGNVTTAITTTGTASASVIYTYAPTSPVPEPATLAMMIGGFATVGGAMRRRGPSGPS